LDYVHKAGFAHRDIKPDNILLDGNFNIKIADFGFAAPIAGRHGTGFLTTKLGTVPYQAPEINENRPYSGAQVDLFALAIVLFITVAGTPPFAQADRNEFYYKLIAGKKWEMFWKYHIRGKPGGANFFSSEFKDLMQRMLAYDPAERLTVSQLREHAWFKGPLPSYEQVVEEFTERMKVNEEEAAKEKAER
jgi:serine/threonine protein kinase